MKSSALIFEVLIANSTNISMYILIVENFITRWKRWISLFCFVILIERIRNNWTINKLKMTFGRNCYFLKKILVDHN